MDHKIRISFYQNVLNSNSSKKLHLLLIKVRAKNTLTENIFAI